MVVGGREEGEQRPDGTGPGADGSWLWETKAGAYEVRTFFLMR